jgi:hypothetical protein
MSVASSATVVIALIIVAATPINSFGGLVFHEDTWNASVWSIDSIFCPQFEGSLIAEIQLDDIDRIILNADNGLSNDIRR